MTRLSTNNPHLIHIQPKCREFRLAWPHIEALSVFTQFNKKPGEIGATCNGRAIVRCGRLNRADIADIGKHIHCNGHMRQPGRNDPTPLSQLLSPRPRLVGRGHRWPSINHHHAQCHINTDYMGVYSKQHHSLSWSGYNIYLWERSILIVWK